MLSNNMKEDLEGKFTENENFEALKVVLEYVYTGVLPEFENEESKSAFNDALNYYRAKD